jgi:DNA-binding response OmpR family regulator
MKLDMKSILIIEDDEMLNSGLCYNLNLEGYQTGSAYDIATAKKKFAEQDWALCILDVNLPDGDGIIYGKELRKQSRIPIIFLTARDMDADMIRGFDAGADDYITKPFNIRILMQRVQAILRRLQAADDNEIFQCGNLEVDFKAYIVKKSGKPLTLTPTEYKLLYKFCKNPGNILTRQVLLEDLWDKNENYVDEHTLTINMSRLRSKIADETYSYIKTIYGMGYQWIGERHE